MTAIAGINILNTPVLVGDLLLSSDDRPLHSVELPTLGSMPLGFKVDRRVYIAGLRQKICLINKNLAVAWSGVECKAKDILSMMRNHFEFHTPSPQSLQDVITEYFKHKGDLDGIALIFLIGERASEQYTSLSMWSLNARIINVAKYGKCHVAGYGRSLIEQYLHADESYNVIGSNVNSMEHAFFRAQAIVARMITDELRIQNTLRRRSGGGGEVCLFSGGMLTKVGEILYLNWSFTSDSNGHRAGLMSPMLKFDYIDDILVIKRLHVGADMTGGIKTHLVQPAHRSLTTFEKANTWSGWGIRCIVNTVEMKCNEEIWYGIMVVGGGQLPISISEEGGKIYMAFDKAWLHTFLAHNIAAFESRSRI